MDTDHLQVTHSKIEGAMNYPSTTQALFALIVMIIVLLFILIYCCWGTFSCAHQEDGSHNADEGAAVVREIQGPGGRGHRMVIVPFSNMIYVGDPESRRIYEIPVEQDKPPAYTEVFEGAPPPPYSTGSQRSDASSNENEINARGLRPPLTDLPPSYDDCLSTTDNKWPEVLEALMSEQAQEPQPSSQTQSDGTLITQLPAIRMPSAMMNQNNVTSLDQTIPFEESVSTPPEENSSLQSNIINQRTTEYGENEPSTAGTNLMDLWSPPPSFQEPSSDLPPPPPTWNQNSQEESNLLNSASPSAPTFSALTENSQTLTIEDEEEQRDEESSFSNATNDDLIIPISTPSTTDSINNNNNPENNSSQTQTANSHSMQSYSNA